MTGEVSNGTLYYLVNDDLGSVSMTLTTSGTVQAYQLFLPFGSSRYSSGSMPTAYGFTAQRLDPSGLNYDHARYYDATVGQFVSADSVQGPNRYAYVGGNPETVTDPSGNCWVCVTIVVGALVGLAVGISQAVVDHKPLSVATIGSIVRDTALGASAGAAIGLNPLGAGTGAVAAMAGLALGMHNGAKVNGEQFFQQVALGADVGFVGGAASAGINGAAGILVSPAAKIIANVAAQGAINAGSDAIGQLINGANPFVGTYNVKETVAAFGFGALGGFIGKTLQFRDVNFGQDIGRITPQEVQATMQPWAGLGGMLQTGIGVIGTDWRTDRFYPHNKK